LALPKKNRLSLKKDIDNVFKRGGTVKGSSLFIKLIDNGGSCSRFAFILPAKHISLATERNRVKRIFSEEIIKNQRLLNRGYDVVISVFKKIDKSRFVFLAQELIETMARIEAIKK